MCDHRSRRPGLPASACLLAGQHFPKEVVNSIGEFRCKNSHHRYISVSDSVKFAQREDVGRLHDIVVISFPDDIKATDRLIDLLKNHMDAENVVVCGLCDYTSRFAGQGISTCGYGDLAKVMNRLLYQAPLPREFAGTHCAAA